ncbi:hypothetical protein BJX65DRAFT_155491 [Aspergillus insuetus]
MASSRLGIFISCLVDGVTAVHSNCYPPAFLIVSSILDGREKIGHALNYPQSTGAINIVLSRTVSYVRSRKERPTQVALSLTGQPLLPFVFSLT